jgi:hypothetical protein
MTESYTGSCGREDRRRDDPRRSDGRLWRSTVSSPHSQAIRARPIERRATCRRVGASLEIDRDPESLARRRDVAARRAQRRPADRTSARAVPWQSVGERQRRFVLVERGGRIRPAGAPAAGRQL